MAGKGEWHDNTLKLFDLSTGFDHLQYGTMKVESPRLVMDEPIVWVRDANKPTFSGALSLDATLLEGEEITLADTIASPDDTEEGFDQDELVQAVRASVDALPDGQRELVQLHDLQGQSIAAAGRRIGLTSSAAQCTYRKGRDRLHRDARLRALAEAHHLDQRTDWHRHVTLSGYRRTWTSSTEALVFWREEQRRRGSLQASAIVSEG